MPFTETESSAIIALSVRHARAYLTDGFYMLGGGPAPDDAVVNSFADLLATELEVYLEARAQQLFKQPDIRTCTDCHDCPAEHQGRCLLSPPSTPNIDLTAEELPPAWCPLRRGAVALTLEEE